VRWQKQIVDVAQRGGILDKSCRGGGIRLVSTSSVQYRYREKVLLFRRADESIAALLAS
jgi:hypothetical protein